ncbi:DUF4129 domain-containing transglutaminase family protein [Barrientosiimonas marina]|uniref:DUF3488 and DUF4129 domain-containing transglutaminase family protein n=1 Tax=Lentibacillus kimchii TaxID=1542911 RepID=A0ABW2USB7_9BACI
MTGKQSFLYTTLLYGCAFILFLEWLYPVELVSDVRNMTVFLVYAIFCFAIAMLRLRWWLSMPLKGMGLVLILDSLFLEPSLFSSAWLNQAVSEISLNLNALMAQHWGALTPLFRSLLFLLLIWMLSYLLYYWFIVMQRVFLFVVMTVVYLSLLDTFTPYDADAAIVRTLIVSFIALGVGHLSQEEMRESVRFAWLKKAPSWVIPLAVLIMVSVLTGFAAPKFDPQWPDPVPFLNSAAENASGLENSDDAGSQKSGYGEDDTQLGGSFVQDKTVVFKAKAQDEHYWRVETKDVYTGKGWKKSQNTQYNLQSSDAIDMDTFSDDVPVEEHKAQVTFQNGRPMGKLVYPYGITGFAANGVAADLDVDMQVDRQFGEIRPVQNGSISRLKQYTVQYDVPSFRPDVLRSVSPGDDPGGLKERYTQLPDSLPERVGELAKEITEDATNRYDKAQSIETYFGQSGFRYQTSNVPVPDADQDYVDQFLFDSKEGYCDNYSTSMVVMLRSLGIPARWAKGFTSGEVVDYGETDDDADVYKVTNANAHSWVEVYFPGSGWVSFEPTQGFSNLTEYQEQDSNAESGNETEQDTEEPETDEPDTAEQSDEADEAAQAQETRSNGSFPWGYVLAGAAVIAVLALVIYKTRFRWRMAYLLRKWQRRPDDQIFQEAYLCLLDLLAHKGVTRRPDETLSEFSQQVDTLYQTTDMGRLTTAYEQWLYKNELTSQDEVRLRELWRQLMKRILA